MAVYLYEVTDGEEVYGFGIVAPDDGTAMRLERILKNAVLLGEMVSPDTTELEVFKKNLN